MELLSSVVDMAAATTESSNGDWMVSSVAPTELRKHSSRPGAGGHRTGHVVAGLLQQPHRLIDFVASRSRAPLRPCLRRPRRAAEEEGGGRTLAGGGVPKRGIGQSPPTKAGLDQPRNHLLHVGSVLAGLQR
jgi:hypothetical protein